MVHGRQRSRGLVRAIALLRPGWAGSYRGQPNLWRAPVNVHGSSVPLGGFSSLPVRHLL